MYIDNKISKYTNTEIMDERIHGWINKKNKLISK